MIIRHCFQVVGSPGNGNNTEEKAAFQMLMQQLSESFKPLQYSLSMEVSPRQDVLRQAYDLKELSQFVDFFSIVNWKLSPAVDNWTAIANPLRVQPNDFDCIGIVSMTSSCLRSVLVRNWDKIGLNLFPLKML